MSEGKTEIHAEVKLPRRFTVPQRVEHALLAISFTVLGITGLVQRYGLNAFSDYLINLMGGIEATRVIHRIAAILFALLGVYHLIVVGYKWFVQRVAMTMMPGPKDAVDGLQWMAYSLFLRKTPPKMPRYTFAEKLEYWALIWGGIIMIVTGFMLWNPLITTQFLPGQLIPAAKAAHGGEAVLAVLAIIVWHFYNVHIKMFNKSMFTGMLTPHQMEEEHELELEGILAGRHNMVQPPAVARLRRLVFIPVAVLIAAGGAGGIYWAATAETTAISTVPAPATRKEIYSPTAVPPPASTEIQEVAAPLIPHPVAGQEQCYACHGKSGFKPVQASHNGRPVESCSICHRKGPSSGWRLAALDRNREKKIGLQPPPHPTTGPYKDCLVCHGIGKMYPFPDHHASTGVDTCTMCHK